MKFAVALALLTVTGFAGNLRDPWLHPFDAKSIWNMPVGSNAVYVPAGIQGAGSFGVDEEVLLRVASDAPRRPLFAPKSWGQRAGGTQHLPPVQINDQDTVPDARKWSTPNYCAALLMPDGHTVRHLGPLCRPEPGGPVFAYHFGESDLHGDGILGSHGASRMSALGGSVRLGELTGDEPIRHAIKCCLFCKPWCYFGEDRKGFRWPAAKADSYADKSSYTGSNKAVVIGSLLALRPDVKMETLRLKTPVATKLFHALQDYGCYIVDDAAHDAFYLCAERGVSEQAQAKWGYKLTEWKELADDIRKLLPLLCAVDNNTADNIGGGCVPRAELAAALAEKPAGEVPKNIPPAPLLKVALKNPQMTEGEGRPAAWTSDWGIGAKAKVTRDTETYHSAPGSLCIESLGGEVQAQVAQTFDVKGGGRLNVSGWLRADGGGNAMLAVQSYTADWKGIALKIIGNNVTGFDWKQVSGDVELSANAAHVGVQLMLQGSGKAWLDDVSADGANPGEGAVPKSVAMPAKPKPQGPPKAKNSCDPAEGFYPDYPEAWRKLHEEMVKRTKEGNVPLIFLGDSLTQGWGKQPHWTGHYAKLGAVNYGIGGDGTAQILWRIQHGLLDGLSPKLIVLGIGVNNIWPGFDAADTIKGIEAVLAAIRAKCPQTKVLLLGNTHLWIEKQTRQRVRAINAAQAKMADSRNVRFLDFSEKMLLEADALNPDFYGGDKLHLNAKGYELWAREMDPVLMEMMR